MSQGIYYSCCIGATETNPAAIIAEAGATNDSVAQVLSVIASNTMHGPPTKRPFGTVNGDVFTYLYAENTLWMAAAPEGFQMRRVMGFLESVRNTFAEKYQSDSKKAARHRDSYSNILAQEMDFWTNDPKADKITSVLGQVEEVKAAMVKNLADVVERGERLELLNEEAKRLETAAEEFHSDAARLRCEKCKSLWCCCCCKCIGPECCPCCAP